MDHQTNVIFILICLRTGPYKVKPDYRLAPVNVILQDINGDILCAMSMGSDSVFHPDAFFNASALFQNYPSGYQLRNCRANLDKATAVGFQASEKTSFCVNNLRLLPSNVVTGTFNHIGAL